MKHLASVLFFVLCFIWSGSAWAQGAEPPEPKLLLGSSSEYSTNRVKSGNQKIRSFQEAKRLLPALHEAHPKTIYCGCSYRGKTVDLKSCGYKPKKDRARAQRLEWEHVVPAEAFGQSFPEWREGSTKCVKKGRRFRGRKCAEKNPEFGRMEGDLYNLWPEIGELNGLRSNFSMAEIPGKPGAFGACAVKLKDRKFEPMDSAKGVVARAYLYMEGAYPGRGIVSGKNRKLFQAWDKLHPPAGWECEWARRVLAKQGNRHPFLQIRCIDTVGSKAPR